MFRTLYSKLALVLTGLLCLVGMAIILVAGFSAEMYQKEAAQRLNLDLADHIVSERLLIRDNRIDEEGMKDIFHMLMVINPRIEIYLLDPEGRILAYSADPGKVKRKEVSLVPVRALLEKAPRLPVLGDDPRNPARQKVFSVARIPEKGELQGYLYVILGGERYDSVVQKLKGSYILQVSAWLIFACLLFSLIVGLVLFATMTGRLRRLSNTIQAFKKGSSDASPGTKIPGGGVDEITLLESVFAEMRQRIESQVDELQRADTERRDMIANVSHDLRTPLATLQGYIETMLLKDKSLPEADRRLYLETALKHCGRLSVLVSELFELAKLESYDSLMVCEPFHPGELVQDVVQKFKLKAAEKKISILTNIERDLPLVNADIGLIERALENLIENAVHYTPEGGEVRLNLAPDQGNIRVQVRDSGCGIPEDELPLIFNRFFQSDKSRLNSTGHSGLGLSIVQKIMELHGRDIEVESKINSGTTFTFHLPCHSPG
ncbi:sensor histidine kinase [Desulfospira joergensenii]|uniref:sensor histidine kinase n=1 Tax=Desulfospira joergensenii TaxID=53329 RepID=UPI0003B4A691|nr:ATP-binding protein [Desulfospira joergensenii]